MLCHQYLASQYMFYGFDYVFPDPLWRNDYEALVQKAAYFYLTDPVTYALKYWYTFNL